MDNPLIFASTAWFCQLIHSFNDLSSRPYEPQASKRVKSRDERSLKLWINLQNHALEAKII